MSTNLDAMRRAVRLRTYANSTEEREAVAAYDARLFDAARDFERAAVTAGERLEEQNRALSNALAHKLAEVRELGRNIANGNAPASAATAKALARMRQQVDALEALAEIADRNAASQAKRLEDPWVAFQAMLDRFPQLNVHSRLG